MNNVIVVDVGTTSIKAVLYHGDGSIRALTNERYSTYRPEPEKAEQNPEEIYQAFQRAVRDLVSRLEPEERVSALSFSSAMHSIIAVDRKNQLLTESWIWSDNRALPQIEKLKAKDNWLRYYHKTGTPVHPMSPFAKLLWMKEETSLIEKTHKFIGIKEYIFYQLTGKYVIDYSVASATGLFNIHLLDWDKEILSELGIKTEQLSHLVDVQKTYAFQSEAAAESLGLSMETELMIGASDGCLANLGAGALKKGDTTLTIGTSGALRMTTDKPLLDEKGRTFCYYLLPDKWVVGGAVNNGGNVIEWLDGILYEEKDQVHQEIASALAKTEPGAENLFFFPYLSGERAPFWDGSLKGSYYGLSFFHSKAHFIRASLEGILFNLKDVLTIAEELGGETGRLLASGGFLRSPEWAQLAANILGIPLTISQSSEGSSLGAFYLARPEVVSTENPKNETVISVESEMQTEYEKLFQKYSWYSQKLLELHKAGKEKDF